MRALLVGSIVMLSGAMLSGCWSSVVRNRAAFDFNCPADQLDLQELTSYSPSYGVRGCGKQATYLYLHGQAVLNSPIMGSTSAAPPTPVPASAR